MVKITPFSISAQRENLPLYRRLKGFSLNIHFKSHPPSCQCTQLFGFFDEMANREPLLTSMDLSEIRVQTRTYRSPSFVGELENALL
jgi:hypothetical protein